MRNLISVAVFMLGFIAPEFWQQKATGEVENSFALGSNNFIDGCKDCGVVGSGLTVNKDNELLISCQRETGGTAANVLFRFPTGERMQAVAWCDGKKWSWFDESKKEKP